MNINCHSEYYFSVENLCKDIFLRRNMNTAGLVPVQVLANFNRVKSLINGDMSVLMDAIRHSHVVELIGNKIRQREHWSSWVLPVEERLPSGKDDEETNLLLSSDRRSSEPAYQTRQSIEKHNSDGQNGEWRAPKKLSSDAPTFVPSAAKNQS